MRVGDGDQRRRQVRGGIVRNADVGAAGRQLFGDLIISERRFMFEPISAVARDDEALPSGNGRLFERRAPVGRRNLQDQGLRPADVEAARQRGRNRVGER